MLRVVAPLLRSSAVMSSRTRRRAAVGRDEQGGRLAGEHRVAHARAVAVRAQHVDAAEEREELLRVAARDREADALVGDAQSYILARISISSARTVVAQRRISG